MSETIHLTVQDQLPVGLTTEQARVINAVSPTATVERVEGGAMLTVHDLIGTTTARINDGAQGAQGPAGQDGQPGRDGVDGSPGAPGQDGADGVSPTVTVTDITGGHRVTITDADGTKTVDVMDGADGQPGQAGADGQDGADGFSPTASVSKTGSTATITITDASGTTTAQVSDGTDGRDGTDGQDGQDGQDGHSPVVTASKSGGVTTVSVDGEPIATINDGAAGPSGVMQVVTVTGTTPTITAEDNHRYVCGEVSTLDITLPASGCIDVTFTSGSTATVLTVTPPTGVTVKWANGFDSTALDANTTYEINIMDGVYGVVGAWT